MAAGPGPMNELLLRVMTEGRAAGEIRVAGESATVGRLPECEVCLPYSGVSRRHARLARGVAGEWTVEDLGASNPTLVNGVALKGVRRLQNSDRLTVGTAVLEVSGCPAAVAEEGGTTTLFARSAADLQQTWMMGAGSGAGLEALRTSRLRELVEIAKGLNLAVSTEGIFARISEAVFRSLGFIDRLALLVDVEGKGELRLLHHAARVGAAESETKWVSRTLCRQAFEERVAILTADAQADERFEGAMSLVAHNVHAAMAAPLWNEEQVVGVLYADATMAANRSAQRQEEDLGFFTSLANLAATATHRWLIDQKLKAEEMVRRRLERYHSPAVVQKLAAASAEGRLVPEEREISVLFADIVGFTSLSESLTPADVARMLNRFFEEMHAPVFRHGGTLDKYIGDCVMAFFGAPERQEDHASRAVRAAAEMLGRLEELNAEGAFVRPLKLRIAINSGAAVVGDIGSVNRLDYTALGATVNLASRIEPLCAPGECLVGEATHALVVGLGGWEDLGLHRFKGIDRDVRVWRWGG